MQTALVNFLRPVSSAIALIYVPALWILAIVHALLGLIGLLSPAVARRQIKVLHGNGRVRIFGVYLVLIGVFIFSQAGYATTALLPQVISVILFLLGGTLVMIPALGLIVVEAVLEKSTAFFRVIALLNIIIAVGFYFAVQLHPAPTPKAPADETPPAFLEELE